jgi:hypothetical protein
MTRTQRTVGLDEPQLAAAAAIAPKLLGAFDVVQSEFVPPRRVYVSRHAGKIFVHDVDDFRWRLFLAAQRQAARDDYDALLLRSFPLDLILAADAGYNIVAAHA